MEIISNILKSREAKILLRTTAVVGLAVTSLYANSHRVDAGNIYEGLQKDINKVGEDVKRDFPPLILSIIDTESEEYNLAVRQRTERDNRRDYFVDREKQKRQEFLQGKLNYQDIRWWSSLTATLVTAVASAALAKSYLGIRMDTGANSNSATNRNTSNTLSGEEKTKLDAIAKKHNDSLKTKKPWFPWQNKKIPPVNPKIDDDTQHLTLDPNLKKRNQL